VWKRHIKICRRRIGGGFLIEGAEPRGEGNAVDETHSNRVALVGEKRLVGDRLDPGQDKLVRVPPAFDQVRDLQRRIIK
jgi:hypothetical protein